METYFEQVNIAEVINEVTNSTAKLAEVNNNEIIVSFESEPESFTTDTTKFRQILYNLINNANKFTKNGKIMVSVSHNNFGEESWLKIVVSDTGIGIEPAFKPLLFERFFRGARHVEGLGIGLPIVKRICNHYGWQINVESKLGKGTTFRITFPLQLLSNIKLAFNK
jgi:signal transduction histidine kinase